MKRIDRHHQQQQDQEQEEQSTMYQIKYVLNRDRTFHCTIMTILYTLYFTKRANISYVF